MQFAIARKIFRLKISKLKLEPRRCFCSKLTHFYLTVPNREKKCHWKTVKIDWYVELNRNQIECSTIGTLNRHTIFSKCAWAIGVLFLSTSILNYTWLFHLEMDDSKVILYACNYMHFTKQILCSPYRTDYSLLAVPVIILWALCEIYQMRIEYIKSYGFVGVQNRYFCSCAWSALSR